MSEAPDQIAETPSAAENPAPESEGQVATPAPEGAAESSDAPAEAPEGQQPASEQDRKPKSPIAQLRGRVGHMTRALHEKDAELAAERRQRETLEALLAAQGNAPESVAAPDLPRPLPSQSTAPVPGTPEFDRLVLAEAQKVAANQAFDRDCNAILETGKEKFGGSFEEGVTNLNALGLMSVPLVQAAMATGAAPDVIQALGSDVDEAARIAALPPVQMGVELAKLATRIQSPKEQPAISRAPAPIKPVAGGSVAELDIYDPHLSDEEYERRRVAMGSRYARKR